MKYKIPTKKKLDRKRILIIALASLVALFTLFCIIYVSYGRSLGWFEESTQTISGDASNSEDSSAAKSTDLSPATEEQIQAGEQTKDSSAFSNENTDEDISVVITSAMQYGDEVEIRSYIDTVTSSGKCRIVLTLDSHSVIVDDIQILPNATTTSCKTTRVPLSKFSSSGDWKLTIDYTSSTTTGKSASRTVKVVKE